MTFKKFEELFLSKYPDGRAVAHGRMGGTEKNQKITVGFSKTSKSYSYYGAYEDVLCRVGINVISKERFKELELRLETLKNRQGKENFFGGVIDNTDEIKEVEERLAKYKAEWIIA